MKEKFKSYILNDQIFFGSILILMSVISFGLGQSSVSKVATDKPDSLRENKVNIVKGEESSVKESAQTTNQPTATKETKYLASKNGKRYYLPECSGVKRIKPENIITFSTKEAAQAAGYTKAVNCSGL